MKKILLLMAAAMLSTAMEAQIVSSRSQQIIKYEAPKPAKVKHALEPRTYIGGTLGSDMTGGELHVETTNGGSQWVDTKGKFGYDLSIGHQMPIGHRFYYGVEAGVASRGYKVDDEFTTYSYSRYGSNYQTYTLEYTHSMTALRVQPIQLGWRPRITNGFEFDLALGFEFTYDLAGSISGPAVDDTDIDWDEGVNKFGTALNWNMGFWVSNFYVGFRFSGGMSNLFDDDLDDDAYPLKYGLNLRYAF